MAQSVEQWMPITAMPALCEIPAAAVIVVPITKLELTAAQQPERVTPDRWNQPDPIVPVLFT